ncbi:MGMT family protein [Endozoicomonas sp. Mp262]|uniref:MGMT family protein n=1 Tax=Endozoicomonas sp. Mp262 TaxID=2919499 RepID=UPI0021DA36B2
MSSPVDPKRVWYILSQIPTGKIITYGQLAEMAGARGCARIIGNILKQLPSGTGLPWHRVINCKGRISFPEGSAHYQKQKERLEQEGISLTTGKVDLQTYRWNGE